MKRRLLPYFIWGSFIAHMYIIYIFSGQPLKPLVKPCPDEKDTYNPLIITLITEKSLPNSSERAQIDPENEMLDFIEEVNFDQLVEESADVCNSNKNMDKNQ